MMAQKFDSSQKSHGDMVKPVMAQKFISSHSWEKPSIAAADWEHLNCDMVEVIALKLDSSTDYTRFRAACAGWRCSLPSKPKRLEKQPFPYLIFPPEEGKLGSYRSLFNPLNGKVVDHLELPEEVGRIEGEDLNFRGFSKGWLVAVEKNGPSIYLINTSPLDGDDDKLVLLPPINTFPNVLEYRPNLVGKEFIIRSEAYASTRSPPDTYSSLFDLFIRKVVLSSSPVSTNCIAMAIYGDFSNLACCKYGDKEWTNVGEQGPSSGLLRDVIFYKDKCYAVQHFGTVIVVDFDSQSTPTPLMVVTSPPDFEPAFFLKQYLVVDSVDNHLLMISRCIEDNEENTEIYETTSFSIYKLEIDFNNSNKGRWSGPELENLDDRVLFLGYNESMSFSSHDFIGCKGNRIYFTDDCYEKCFREDDVKGIDTGILDLETNSFEELNPGILWPPPVWVMRQNS